jgi:hypothetical protein
MMEINGTHQQGFLHLLNEDVWSFITKHHNQQIATATPLPTLPFDWRGQIDDQSLILEWQDVSPILGSTDHVSATTSQSPCPSSLKAALDLKHLDRKMWYESYKEEYHSLMEFDMFEEIEINEYSHIATKHGPAIPPMCVLVIKKDADENPTQSNMSQKSNCSIG